MTVYAQWDTDDQEDLATNLGWGQLGAWVDSLDAGDYPQVVHLWEHGFSQRLPDLEDQLTDAVKESPPEVADVRATAGNLLGIVRGRPDDAEVLLVTNGLEADAGGPAGPKGGLSPQRPFPTRLGADDQPRVPAGSSEGGEWTDGKGGGSGGGGGGSGGKGSASGKAPAKAPGKAPPKPAPKAPVKPEAKPPSAAKPGAAPKSALPGADKYTPHKTIEEATRYAEDKLGVNEAHLGDDIDVANHVLGALTALKTQQGMRMGMPGIIEIVKSHPGKPNNIASFGADDNRITITVSAKQKGEELVQNAIDRAAEGKPRYDWMSSDDLYHHITHEYGHYRHDATGGYKDRDGSKAKAHAALRDTIEKEVSRYAKEDYNEFVAETYAGLAVGKKYSPPIMDLFKKVGGKHP